MKRRRGNRPKMAPDDPRRKNLMPPARKGEVRNPKGINGHTRLQAFYDFADEEVEVPQGRGKPAVRATRAQLARLALFENVLRGDTGAQKLFTEQLQGRARMSVEVTGADGGPLDVKAEGGAGVVDLLRRIAGVKEE